MDQTRRTQTVLDLLTSAEGLDAAFSALTAAPAGQGNGETDGIREWYASKQRMQAAIDDIAKKC
jgi:hypothetical protein